MKDHRKAEMVNEITALAKRYAETQQLREHMNGALLQYLAEQERCTRNECIKLAESHFIPGHSIAGPDFAAALVKKMREHCKKCGGNMKSSKAIDQTFTGVPDFHDGEIVTMSPGGKGKLIDCLKCEDCGYSLTV